MVTQKFRYCCSKRLGCICQFYMYTVDQTAALNTYSRGDDRDAVCRVAAGMECFEEGAADIGDHLVQLAAADRYVRFVLAAKGREHMSQETHRSMLEAAATRDIESALAILDEHLSVAADKIAKFFAERA